MTCPHCSAEVPEGDTFCNACGQRFRGHAAANAQTVQNDGSVTIPVTYAGFWLRLVAFIIDLALLFIPLMLIIGILAQAMGVTDKLQKIQPGQTPEALIALLGSKFVIGMLVTLILGIGLYFSLCECSPWRATLGKRMLGLFVLDLAGNRISFGRASARFFAGKLVVFALPGLGLLYFVTASAMAGLSARKQALYDMATGCLILRKL